MELSEIRSKIDLIDAEILRLLSRRFALMPEVALCKKEQQTGILDKNREKEVMGNRLKIAEPLGLSEDFVIELFTIIMNESKRIQKEQ